MDDKEHPGWIKLWRQLLDTAIWGNRDLVCLFVYCLLKANHSEAWVNIKGHNQPVKVLPGQFITGQHSLHRGLCNEGDSEAPSSRTVWRWLHALKELQMLEMDTTVSNRFTIVSICNWVLYQAVEDGACQVGVKPVSSTCQGRVKGVSTGKKVKKVKNIKNEKKPPVVMPEIPDYLKDVWPDWVASRTEQKKPLKPNTVRLQLKALAKVSESEAVSIVEYSAMNNYQGLIFDRRQSTPAKEPCDFNMILEESRRQRKAKGR